MHRQNIAISIIYSGGLTGDELMMVIASRLLRYSGDSVQLHTDLLELCGTELFDVVAVIIANREALLQEYQVFLLASC